MRVSVIESLARQSLAARIADRAIALIEPDFDPVGPNIGHLDLPKSALKVSSQSLSPQELFWCPRGFCGSGSRCRRPLLRSGCRRGRAQQRQARAIREARELLTHLRADPRHGRIAGANKAHRSANARSPRPAPRPKPSRSWCPSRAPWRCSRHRATGAGPQSCQSPPKRAANSLYLRVLSVRNSSQENDASAAIDRVVYDSARSCSSLRGRNWAGRPRES